jgi:hypothetical protein
VSNTEFQRYISFHIITDLETELPADLKAVRLVRIPSGALGAGFSPKPHLDTLAPVQHTLFIDADCLCVGPVVQRRGGSPPPHRLNRPTLPVKTVRPLIPHFIDDYTDHWRSAS